jgi:hypothetical protein
MRVVNIRSSFMKLKNIIQTQTHSNAQKLNNFKFTEIKIGISIVLT